MTPEQIISSKTELWLNSPEGYPFAEKIEKSDVQRLKGFLINLTADVEFQEEIRAKSHEEIIKALLESNFTFDEQFVGARPLPEQRSRLDDPDYQRKMGFKPSQYQ